MISDAEIQKLFLEHWAKVCKCKYNENSGPDYYRMKMYFAGFKAALALSEKMQAEKCCETCKDHNNYCNIEDEIPDIRKDFCSYWKKRED